MCVQYWWCNMYGHFVFDSAIDKFWIGWLLQLFTSCIDTDVRTYVISKLGYKKENG